MADKKMTIEEVKDNLLDEGPDYGLTKGIPKPFLTLAGAQKVAKYYEYTHALEIQEAVENHAEKFYFYRVICRIVSDGQIIGDMIGACSTHDSGKRNAPPNSILKMAEKRAYVSAVLYVVAGSGLFSADVEDMSPDELGANGTSENGIKWFPRKAGGSNWRCGACGNQHIAEGELVSKVDGKWVAKDCYEHLKSVAESSPPEEKSQGDKLKQTVLQMGKPDELSQYLAEKAEEQGQQ